MKAKGRAGTLVRRELIRFRCRPLPRCCKRVLDAITETQILCWTAEVSIEVEFSLSHLFLVFHVEQIPCWWGLLRVCCRSSGSLAHSHGKVIHEGSRTNRVQGSGFTWNPTSMSRSALCELCGKLHPSCGKNHPSVQGFPQSVVSRVRRRGGASRRSHESSRATQRNSWSGVSLQERLKPDGSIG